MWYKLIYIYIYIYVCVCVCVCVCENYIYIYMWENHIYIYIYIYIYILQFINLRWSFQNINQLIWFFRFVNNINATNQFPIYIKLGVSWPAGKSFQTLSHFFIFQNIKCLIRNSIGVFILFRNLENQMIGLIRWKDHLKLMNWRKCCPQKTGPEQSTVVPKE